MKDGEIKVEFLSELTHMRVVNCVRFSPNGDFLATGTDSGAMAIWRLLPTAGVDIAGRIPLLFLLIDNFVISVD